MGETVVGGDAPFGFLFFSNGDSVVSRKVTTDFFECFCRRWFNVYVCIFHLNGCWVFFTVFVGRVIWLSVV
ncbi:hypothetical protein HanIR_Chr15g0730491 [Helianthus annuus]|nr:hypothetical protein HanIR_Chr15g0730491 [Helianthus annuus]